MTNIEHLFENVLTCLDTGGDPHALELHPTIQAMLRGVYASFDEILAMALYVKHNYCTTCESRHDEMMEVENI